MESDKMAIVTKDQQRAQIAELRKNQGKQIPKKETDHDAVNRQRRRLRQNEATECVTLKQACRKYNSRVVIIK